MASIAAKITGHASERTLRKHYHRSSDAQVRQAVAALPSISTEAIPAAGAQQIPQHLSRETMPNGAIQHDGHDNHSSRACPSQIVSDPQVSDATQLVATMCVSEGDGNRTRNLRIDSPVL